MTSPPPADAAILDRVEAALVKSATKISKAIEEDDDDKLRKAVEDGQQRIDDAIESRGIGADGGVAVSAVLEYRLVSYYLPPIWDYVCLRWLTRHDYL